MSIEPGGAATPATEAARFLEDEGCTALFTNGNRPFSFEFVVIGAVSIAQRCMLSLRQFGPAPLFCIQPTNSGGFCGMFRWFGTATPVSRHLGSCRSALGAAFTSKTNLAHIFCGFFSMMFEKVLAVGFAQFKIFKTIVSAVFVFVVDRKSTRLNSSH